ncbi:MAG: hypothetical protein JWP59_4526 [Massilia sp.]|nr:hypothetical protein [Massilia sp.]
MTKNSRLFASLSAPASLAAGLAFIFVYLCFRNTGLYPTIFSDETAYSTFARLTPFSEATVPSYLYFALFRTTNSCGDGFLDCARLLNSLLFLAAAPFMYAIARRLMPPALACMCALVSVGGPANVYTLYFMPEATYFLFFWALTWAVLRHQDEPTVPRTLLAGIILGLLALIKAHGLFVIPAVCLFLVWGCYTRRTTTWGWLIDALQTLALLLAAAAVVRFGIAYLMAGTNGLSLFGPLYRSQAGNSPAATQSISHVVTVALGVLRGHLLGLLVLFGVPLTVLLTFGAVRPLRASASPQVRALALYATLMLASLIAVTVMFTVSVSGTGFDTDQRLHMRYYDFALPLLTIFVASQVNLAVTSARRIVLPVASAACLALLYAAWRLPLDYTPLIADSPALHGLTMFPKAFPFFCALILATIVAWAFNARRGATLFVYALMPILAIGAGLALGRELRWAVYSDPYVNGAKFARDFLDPQALDKITVVGASLPGLYKAKFYLSTAGMRMKDVANTEQFDLAAFADKKNWLLIVGTFKVPGAYAAQVIEGKGYTLLRPQKPQTPGVTEIDFSQPLPDAMVVRYSGLSTQEAFGRWSDAKQVELELAAPLPKHLSLEMKVQAYGPNSGREVIVTIGKETRRFRAPEALETVKLEFDTSGSERTIGITIPMPTSPKQTGTGDDARALGLSFHHMHLRDKETAAIGAP